MKFILGLILAFSITQVSAQLKITNIKTGEVKTIKENTKISLIAKTDFSVCECKANEMVEGRLSKVTADSVYVLTKERNASSGTKEKTTSEINISYKEGYEINIAYAKNQIHSLRKTKKTQEILQDYVGPTFLIVGLINGLVLSPLTGKLRPAFDVVTYSMLGGCIVAVSINLSKNYFFQENDSNKPIEWKF